MTGPLTIAEKIRAQEPLTTTEKQIVVDLLEEKAEQPGVGWWFVPDVDSRPIWFDGEQWWSCNPDRTGGGTANPLSVSRSQTKTRLRPQSQPEKEPEKKNLPLGPFAA